MSAKRVAVSLVRHIASRTASSASSTSSTFSTAAQTKVSSDSVNEGGGQEQLPIWATPFSQPIPGVKDIRSSTAAAGSSATAAAPSSSSSIDPFRAQLTTLDSKLRIASIPKHGEYVTLGVVIDAGSRYEAGYLSGITHFIQKLSFSSTQKFASAEDLHSSYENYSGIVDAMNAKDIFIYACSCHRSGVSQLLDVIAETMCRPRITQEEFDIVKQMIRFELQDADNKPDRSAFLHDLIHQAAFGNETVGLPKLCPIENVDNMTRETLLTFMSKYFTPDRTVVAGIGVDHEELVAASKRCFIDSEPIWKDSALLANNAPPTDKSVAKYKGGYVSVEKNLGIFDFGPSPFPNLAHMIVGLESCSFKDDDFVAYCVLNSYLGGGSSFSSGGPGKGLYTNLYTTLLSGYHWLYSCQAENYAYADSGVFTISASCPPSRLHELGLLLVQKFLSLRDKIGDKDLERAKKQLQSMLFMNLEARPVMFEDLGRQILGNGFTRTPQEYTEMINSVTTDDIQRVAHRMLSSKPSVVAYGDLSRACDYAAIEASFSDKTADPILKEFKAISGGSLKK